MRRSGVTASVIIRNTSAKVPVVWVMNSTGLAPNPPVKSPTTSRAAGISDAAKTTTLIQVKGLIDATSV